MRTQVIATALKLLVRQYFVQHPDQFKGEKGDKGDPGVRGQIGPSVSTESVRLLVSDYFTANRLQFKGDKGDKGDRGDKGDQGAAGRDGVGLQGPAGDSASLKWRGEYRKGIEYKKGDIVGWRDAVWICLRNDTYSEPSRGSKSWDLFIAMPSSGKVLNSFGGTTAWGQITGNPISVSGTPAAGTFLRSDGTNFVTSTLKLPNTLSANQVLFGSAVNAVGESTSLTYDDTAKRLTVGSGTGTSSGWTVGYFGLTGVSGIWSTAVGAPSGTNYAIGAFGTGVTLNAPANGTIAYKVGNVALGIFGGLTDGVGVAGAGLTLTAGTAASAVSALSLTQTWNYNGAAINAVDWTFTDTASHANTLAWRVRAGAAGGTLLAHLTKGGQLNAVSYAVGGVAGVSFGPAAVASITIVNGIVTAIS